MTRSASCPHSDTRHARDVRDKATKCLVNLKRTGDVEWLNSEPLTAVGRPLETPMTTTQPMQATAFNPVKPEFSIQLHQPCEDQKAPDPYPPTLVAARPVIVRAGRPRSRLASW